MAGAIAASSISRWLLLPKCISKTFPQERNLQIWEPAIRFGTVLENVVMDPDSRKVDYDSTELTENTRAAYPIDFIDKAVIPGVGGHPTHVLFLTADAFGVLPPISRLTPEQAMYHFLSGYTAKLAGTERGLGKEPAATFSACFGEPFLPRHPEIYAKMLGERLQRHKVTCYLVNTGWVGGPFGIGERMSLKYTRAMVNAAIDGQLDHVATEPHPVFRVLVPKSVPGVPSDLLDARTQWKDGEAYDRAAESLSARFRKNFEKFGEVSEEHQKLHRSKLQAVNERHKRGVPALPRRLLTDHIRQPLTDHGFEIVGHLQKPSLA